MTSAATALTVEHEPAELTSADAPATESAAIFQIISRLASNPAADPDKIERFLAMREKEIDRIAKQAFYVAMAAAQAEMKPVARDADNDQTRSKYARYETISEAIQPIITKHGFSLTFDEGVPEKENHIRVLCDVMHSAGHMKQYHADVPFDNVGMKGNPNKTATHAYGSTKSYGRRYLKLDIFDIALKNDDDDGNAAGEIENGTITIEQAVTIRDLLEKTGTDTEKFCQWAKIEAVPDLLSIHFAKAVNVLTQRLGQS